MVKPLHRVTFNWGEQRSIDIEWIKGKGAPLNEIIPYPAISYAEVEIQQDEFSRNGIPAICYRENNAVLFESFQLRENTEYLIDITIPTTKNEAIIKIEHNPGWPFLERIAKVFEADPPRRWRENPKGTLTISGRLRIRNHAGILDFNTDYGTNLLAEVVCKKFNYLDEFQALLSDVAEEFTELLLKYDSPVSLDFDLGGESKSLDSALIFQFRYIMRGDNLPLSVNEIVTRFHTSLVNKKTLQPISQVEEFDIDVYVDNLELSDLSKGGPLASLFHGYTPSEMYATEITENYDTQ